MPTNYLPKGSLLVVVGFVTLAVAFAVRVLFALVMPDMSRDTGWSVMSLSAAMSVAMLVSGVLTPVAGRLADRRGPRDALVFGLALIAMGLGLVAISPGAWLVIFGFGVVSGGGFALVSTTVVATAIANLFDRHRGLATGITTSGESAGQFLLIPAFALLLGISNWRLTMLAATALTVLVLVLAFMFMPRRPAGQVAARPSAGAFKDALILFRQPVFLALFGSYFICGLTTSGFVETQFMPYVSFCGFPPLPTATTFGILSFCNMLGMLFSGWLTDRVNRIGLLAGIYALRGLSFVLLVGSGADFATLTLFAVVFGFADYSTVPVTVSLSASYLGVERLGYAFGLISGGHAVAAALGAILGGTLYEASGSYSLMWLVGLWTSFGAAAITITLIAMRPPARAAQ